MKLKEAVSLMKEQGLIDEGEVYSYGQTSSVLGGAVGAMANAVLICVKDDVLRVFQAHLNNSWSNNLLTAKKEELSSVKVKNVFSACRKNFALLMRAAIINLSSRSAAKNLSSILKILQNNVCF